VSRPQDDLPSAFAETEAILSYERDRFGAQLAFARALLKRHRGAERSWEQLLEETQRRVCGALRAGRLVELREKVREAETLLAPIAEVAKSYTIYCVGHAHIDMNWMWSWPETVAVTVDSVGTVLRLMEEFPDFRFSQSQASVYAILQRHRPDLLERVQARVREGRWEVTASHWVEGDKNLTDGESLCRHLLYTRAYMRELFGLSPEEVPIDWSPDTFGHAATVPAYLVRGGVRYLYLHRPGGRQGRLRPQAFFWQAPDGSRVLVRNDMYLGYNGVIAPDMIPRSLLSFVQETGLPLAMFVYGCGDHGGGPTRRDLARILDMDGWPVYPRIRFATARSFFERLEQEGGGLPVVAEELNYEFTGCYTTQSLIKRSNRYALRRLRDAEAASLLARAAAATPYRAEALEEAWKDTLFSHFHDILPGSGVRDTRTFSHGLFQKTVAMTAALETQALRALAARVDTGTGGSAGAGTAGGPGSGGAAGPAAASPEQLGYLYPTGMGGGAGMEAAEGALSRYGSDRGATVHPLVVFNLGSHPRCEVIEAVVWDPGSGWQRRRPEELRFVVEGPDGGEVTPQVVERGSYWGHAFQRLAFPARVPGFGYARYLVRERPWEPGSEVPGLGAPGGSEPAAGGTQPAAGSEGNTNARQIGHASVCRYSAYERSPEGLENEYLRVELDPQSGGIASLLDRRSGVEVVEGRPGQGLLQYLLERPRSMSAWLIEHSGPPVAPEVHRVERLQNGPFKAALRAHLRVGQSELELTYELRSGDPKLYLRVRGTWFERGGKERGTPALRLALPLKLEQPSVSYEIPFGSQVRELPSGEEAPALSWACVQGRVGRRRMACALFNDSKHGYSFLRGTLYLSLIRSSFDPDPLPEIGEHDAACALAVYAGEVPAAQLSQEAARFEHELKVVSTDVHTGELALCGGLLAMEEGSLVLSGLKQSEGGEGVIVRFYNPGGEAAKARFRFHAAFGTPKEATAVDLLERPVAPTGGMAAVSLRGGEITLELPAFGIGTAKIVFGS
jgi:alpha-mannosidase